MSETRRTTPSMTRRQMLALSGLAGAYIALGPTARDAFAAQRATPAATLPPVAGTHPRLVFAPDTVARQRAQFRTSPLFGELDDWARSQIILPGTAYQRSNAIRDAAFVAQVRRDTELAATTADAFRQTVAEILGGSYETGDDQLHSMTATNLGFGYDWLHDQLDEADRTDGAAALVRLNEYNLERFFYNFDAEGDFPFAAFNNHAIQAWASVAVAALAAVDEHPDGRQWAEFAHRAFVDTIFPIFDLVIGDGGIWSEGTHYNQVGIKPLFYVMDALRSATGENHFDAPWVRSAPYYWPYLTRPDGTFTIMGDWVTRTDSDTLTNLYARTFWIVAKAAAETRDGHLQAYANASIPQIPFWRLEAWHVAWHDHRLRALPTSRLTPDRLFRSDAPQGGECLAVLRTGWEDDATIVTLTAGDWHGHHDHFDAAAFTIHHRGDLAIDPGYEGETLNDWKFYRRTAAHCSVLVDAPEAAADMADHPWGWDGGGQRVVIVTERPRNVAQYHELRHPDYPEHSLFETADVVGYVSTRAFGYVAVDATLAYRASQVTSFFRHLIFLKPSLIAVYDVIHTPPGRSPVWLMQSVTAPTLTTRGFSVTNGGGELAATTVLPASPTVTSSATPAGHRVEVRTPAGQEHRFLHLIAVGDAGVAAAPSGSADVVGDRLSVRLGDGFELDLPAGAPRGRASTSPGRARYTAELAGRSVSVQVANG